MVAIAFYLNLILFYFIFTNILSFELIYIKIYKLGCDYDPKYIENVTCKLTPKNWTKSVCSVEFDLKHPLKTIWVNGALAKRFSEYAVFQPYLANLTGNMCDLVAGKKNVFLMNMVFKMILPHSNLNHPCPFSEHIFVRNFSFKEEALKRLPVPTGTYRLNVSFHTHKNRQNYIGSVNFYVTVAEIRNKA